MNDKVYRVWIDIEGLNPNLDKNRNIISEIGHKAFEVEDHYRVPEYLCISPDLYLLLKQQLLNKTPFEAKNYTTPIECIYVDFGEYERKMEIVILDGILDYFDISYTKAGDRFFDIAAAHPKRRTEEIQNPGLTEKLKDIESTMPNQREKIVLSRKKSFIDVKVKGYKEKRSN